MPRWPLQAWAVGLSVLSEQVTDAIPASLSKSCASFNFQENFFFYWRHGVNEAGSVREKDTVGVYMMAEENG